MTDRALQGAQATSALAGAICVDEGVSGRAHEAVLVVVEETLAGTPENEQLQNEQVAAVLALARWCEHHIKEV